MKRTGPASDVRKRELQLIGALSDRYHFTHSKLQLISDSAEEGSRRYWICDKDEVPVFFQWYDDPLPDRDQLIAGGLTLDEVEAWWEAYDAIEWGEKKRRVEPKGLKDKMVNNALYGTNHYEVEITEEERRADFRAFEKKLVAKIRSDQGR